MCTHDAPTGYAYVASGSPATVVVGVVECKVVPLQLGEQVLLHSATGGLQGPPPANQKKTTDSVMLCSTMHDSNHLSSLQYTRASIVKARLRLMAQPYNSTNKFPKAKHPNHGFPKL